MGMIVSIASGKGGTGKTLVSTNLALSLEGKGIQFLDCDVEEPNAFLFLKPDVEEEIPVEVLVPEVNQQICTHCKKCAEFCEYNAIFVTSKTVQVFPELCHSCGGCALVCPVGAIIEVPFKIGNLKIGKGANVDLVYGELEVSKPLAVPIIREVKKRLKKDKLVIVDSPPGASCPMIEAVSGSDFVILVTEPTPFGFHDLKITVDVLEKIGIPFGIIINRANLGNRDVYEFCMHKNIPVLLEIPYDRKIAELYSRAIPFVTVMEEWKGKFREVYQQIERMFIK
ncbi:MAG: ATP-binding protein [bacterium]|nr:ATP-binding protein [bacterium]